MAGLIDEVAACFRAVTARAVEETLDRGDVEQLARAVFMSVHPALDPEGAGAVAFGRCRDLIAGMLRARGVALANWIREGGGSNG